MLAIVICIILCFHFGVEEGVGGGVVWAKVFGGSGEYRVSALLNH